jgi:hypothetical protein
MHLQKNVLETYQKLYGPVTIRKMADHTGIQMTRVFRLMNGHEMKLSEYEVFNHLNNLQGAKSKKLMNLIQNAQDKLTENALSEIEEMIERKVRLYDYLHGQVSNDNNLSIAA